MYHYLFTNDLRITTLQTALTKAGQCFMTDTVPSADENKNENNNMNTLGFYFNLTHTSKCAVDCANGHVRKVVLNFIKKFQFPNPRTPESLKAAMDDGISVAPMRVVIQVLYTMNLLVPGSAFLTRDEVLDFIFFNSSVAKTRTPNIIELIHSIIEYRKTKQLPPTVETDTDKRFWKQTDRQVREMVKILTWSGCVSEDENQALIIHHDNLSVENKAALFDILTYTQFWTPDKGKNFYENKVSYQAYMDIEECEGGEESVDTKELSPDWFKSQAEGLITIDQEADALYEEFKKYFAPDILKLMAGRDMLDKLFYSDHRAEHNLCHTLEHDTRFQLFGGIKGGSSYKFGLFYSKEQGSWITGSPKKVVKLTEEDAIDLGASIRDELVAGAEAIANYGELNDLNDYVDLYARVFKVMPTLINKMWAMKYLHMIFPNIFPVFYSEEWQDSVLNKLNIEPKENSFIRMGQIALFVKKCGISNVAFSKVFYQIKNDTGIDQNGSESAPDYKYDFSSVVEGAQNLVVYGTPGCGKSFYVENTYLNKLGVLPQNRIRTTFFQDYTNTDFVGQILPKVNEDTSVTYEFNPGPFSLALKLAIENQDCPVALIIEELNRGNAASIFGDIFQLLDRDITGKSRYNIVNINIQGFLNKCFDGQYSFDCIQLPSNFYIVATMNTSDQNVFTLDTAFKRRWQFEKIKNKFTADHKYRHYYVPGMADVTWEQLVTDINDSIVRRPSGISSEDKQLGVYFINEDTLCATKEECDDEQKIDKFAYKLFEYLWDDVAKYGHEDWFASDIKTLDDLIEEYKKRGKAVFVDGVLSNGEN